jgi:hypothetical protein
VRFKLTSSTAGATFECRVDSKGLKPCSAKKTARVKPGVHRFRYRPLGSRGRPGKTKSYRFRVVP